MSFTCVCEGASLVDAIRQDVDRYVFASQRAGQSGIEGALRLTLSPRVWTVVNHRLSHAALTRVRWRPLRSLLEILSFITQRVIRNACGIQVDPMAHIGPGLFFPHEGGIVIGAVRMGRNCTVSQGVTLGRGEREPDSGDSQTPVLGDRVWLGPGAVVAGRLTVGSDAVVGANGVLLRHLAAAAVAVGIPARVVSHEGSFTMVRYRDMALDDERSAAIARAEVAGAPGQGWEETRPGSPPATTAPPTSP